MRSLKPPPNKQPVVGRHFKVLFHHQACGLTKTPHILDIPYTHVRSLRSEVAVEPLVARAGMFARITERTVKAKNTICWQGLANASEHRFHLGPGHDVSGVGGEGPADGRYLPPVLAGYIEGDGLIDIRQPCGVEHGMQSW